MSLYEEIAQDFSTVPQASRPVISRSGFFCGHFPLKVKQLFI